MKKDDISEVVKLITENESNFIKESKITYNKLFEHEKENIILLVKNRNISIKMFFDEFVKKGILKKKQSDSFARWVKAEIAKIEKSNDAKVKMKIEDELLINSFDIPVKTTSSETQKKTSEIYTDSRNVFHGFDMNEHPNEETNPIPVRPEIDHLYLCEIFASDHELNNDKIVNILLCTIKIKKKNMFINTWPYLLLKGGETKEDYYSRLQLLVDSDMDEDREISYEILNATTCMQGYALAAKYDGLKLIRRTHA